MFGRTREDHRPLSNGSRVSCPLRGTDVDIEVCMACGKLHRVVSDDPPYVTCTALPRAAWTSDQHHS